MEELILSVEYDTWWSSLTCKEKERIANKANKKFNIFKDTDNVVYPLVTTLWLALSPMQKEFIHDHCVDKHGLLLPEFQEGKSMSY